MPKLRETATEPAAAAHGLGEPATCSLILRLRESAGRMVPFSEQKTLLRAAAATIERLDSVVRNQAADLRRLEAELLTLHDA